MYSGEAPSTQLASERDANPDYIHRSAQCVARHTLVSNVSNGGCKIQCRPTVALAGYLPGGRLHRIIIILFYPHERSRPGVSPSTIAGYQYSCLTRHGYYVQSDTSILCQGRVLLRRYRILLESSYYESRSLEKISFVGNLSNYMFKITRHSLLVKSFVFYHLYVFERILSSR